MEQFTAFFSEVPDPRAANARHDLLELMFIALAAVLCGAEGCADMAAFGRAKQDLLKQILKLPHGPPSHDTFSRVFRMLDPEPLEAAFARFTRAFAGPLQGVVAIDGKALRGAYLRGRRATPLHLVNVWAAEARLALSQRLAPRRNEKAGALEAIALLSLDHCIVTADALHCHPAMAEAVIHRGGDYVLALKDNQPKLLAEAKARIRAAPSHAIASATATGHDRTEVRRALVVAAPGLAEAHGFPAACAVARVESFRRVGGRDEPLVVRHFILSTLLPAERVIDIVRTHWSIENQLHWVLDVVLDEDRARSRKDNGPQNLALMRKLALNILRRHPDKASIRLKIKRAAWDNLFLISLLAQMR